MQIDMKRFHAAFFDEAAEHLGTMEEALLVLERDPADGELLHRIFRAAHSIKGASGTFGFGDIAAFTHGMEGLLDRMRDGQIAPTPHLIELLLRSADTLGALVSAAKDGTPLPAEVESLIAALEAAKGGTSSPAAAAAGEKRTEQTADPCEEESREYQIQFVPGPDLIRHGMDPLLLLRDLAAQGEVLEVLADTSRLPDLAELVPDECCLGWTIRLRTPHRRDEVEAVFVFVEDSSQLVIEEAAVNAGTPSDASAKDPARSADTGGCSMTLSTAGPSVAKPEGGRDGQTASASPPLSQSRSRSIESSSIRVSVEKVDELINLVGELVIAQSMVNDAINRVPPELLSGMQEALTTMNRCTRDLQDRVMSVRMVPLASVFRRFPRVVHDMAGTLGKRIAVEISGEDTELDKQMIEQLADPLTHLVRNAADHGIEMPDQRQLAGKPPEGRITLRAFQEGGNVVIEVGDDGRGLNAKRIREKAIALGQLPPDGLLTEEQIHALVFAPGFSTAEQVSDISGRGVGMDVVKRNIEALNGSVGIQSSAGRGTTFRIRLPLTMAIVDGLAASLDGQIYILPLLSVIESFQPKPAEVKTVAGRGEVIVVRGKPLPLVRLHRVFHSPAGVTDPTQGLVILVENQGKRLGLLVDGLLGQMQVVMKSLEANYEKVEGVSAATILGDGQVAFILDVPGLARLAQS